MAWIATDKAFIVYEKISKTIESVINEEQIRDCQRMVDTFIFRQNSFENPQLANKLVRELEIKIKSFNS